MPRSKELWERVQKQVLEAHKAGKGYKKISKLYRIHLSTVRQIVYKWRLFKTTATLHHSGQPPKITPRNRRKLVLEVTKSPCVLSNKLQESLQAAGVDVHCTTIRKTLNKVEPHGRVA